MSQPAHTIDLSTDELKTVKKIHASSVAAELRKTGRHLARHSPACVTLFIRFSRDELLGMRATNLGVLEIDLEQDEQPAREEVLDLGAGLLLRLRLVAEPSDEGYAPNVEFTLCCGEVEELGRDSSVQVICRLYDSSSREMVGRQKFSLTPAKLTKTFEPRREFERAQSLDFVLETLVDATGFTREIGLPNGIVNLGVTCYMNSYLQTVFHLKKFRYYINQLHSEGPSDFIFCLQSLFYALEHGEQESHTLDLVKAFGWNLEQMFMQQDVQEFSLKLLDAIEERSKRQGVAHIVTKELFRGRMESFIKCVNVEFASRRAEDFYELQLNIKEVSDLAGALGQLLQHEQLFGENAYDTETLGKQDALKGVSLLALPDVLVFNVNRSDYNLETFEPVKLLSEFRFEESFDMTRFCEDGGDYTLFAVFVHIGFDSGRGHYTVFVKPDEQWFEFNDEVVSRMDWSGVSRQSWGGKTRETAFDAKIFELKERLKDSPSHAYMLVYVRGDKFQEVVHNCGEVTPYPPHVVAYTQNKLRSLKKKKRREDTFKVYFTTAENFVNKPTGVGELFYCVCGKDPQDMSRFREAPYTRENLPREIRAAELLEFVAQRYGAGASVYIFSAKRKLLRAVKATHNSPQFDVNLYEQHVFVHRGDGSENDDILTPVLVVLKEYDDKTDELRVKAISLEDTNATLMSVVAKLSGVDATQLAVFCEPNYSRYSLSAQDDLTAQLTDLLTSRVRSEDVMTLVYTANTAEAIEQLQTRWDKIRESIYVNLWLEPERSENHIFGTNEPAQVLLQYLAIKGLIEDPKDYGVTASVNNQQMDFEYEKLGGYKVGNLICEDNSILVNKIERYAAPLHCDVKIYDFKVREYIVIKKNVQSGEKTEKTEKSEQSPTKKQENGDEKQNGDTNHINHTDEPNNHNTNITITPQMINDALRRNEPLREAITNNTDFFNTRYRRFTVARYKQVVYLKTGGSLIFTDESLLADDIAAVYLIPVIALVHRHTNGSELQIKTDANGHAGGCCDNQVSIDLHFQRSEVGPLQVGFTADRRMTLEELDDALTGFVKKTRIGVEPQEVELTAEESPYSGFVLRWMDAADGLKSFREAGGQRLESIAADGNVEAHVIGVEQPRGPLEIEVSPVSNG